MEHLSDRITRALEKQLELRQQPLSEDQIDHMQEEMSEDVSEPDKIEGGYGDNVPSAAFDVEQLERGIEVELEHTNDREKAEEIAKDHLMENPAYYEDLYMMETANAERDVKKLHDALIQAMRKKYPRKFAFDPARLQASKISPAEGEQIAEQLGVVFNGIQPTVKGPGFYLFTDPATGSTFAGDTLQTAQESLEEMRAKFARKKQARDDEEELPPGTLLGPGGEIISEPGKEEEDPPLKLEPPRFLSRKPPGVEEEAAEEATPEEAQFIEEINEYGKKIDQIQQEITALQKEMQTKIAPLQKEMGAATQGQMRATKALTTLMDQLQHTLIQVDDKLVEFSKVPAKTRLTPTQKVKILLDKFGDDAARVLAEAQENLDTIANIVGRYKQWPKKMSADDETTDKYLAALYQETYNALADLLDTANELNFTLAA